MIWPCAPCKHAAPCKRPAPSKHIVAQPPPAVFDRRSNFRGTGFQPVDKADAGPSSVHCGKTKPLAKAFRGTGFPSLPARLHHLRLNLFRLFLYVCFSP